MLLLSFADAIVPPFFYVLTSQPAVQVYRYCVKYFNK